MTPPPADADNPADPADTPPPADQLGEHDHAACVARALGAIDALGAERRIKLTPARRRVFEILLESHAALGAYDILGRLGDEGAAPQPPVVYRALEFLMAHGFVHRIERLNAYVACVRPGACPLEAEDPAFLICRECHAVAEARAAPARGALGEAARAAGFRIERTVVEAIGLCAACEGTAESRS